MCKIVPANSRQSTPLVIFVKNIMFMKHMSEHENITNYIRFEISDTCSYVTKMNLGLSKKKLQIETEIYAVGEPVPQCACGTSWRRHSPVSRRRTRLRPQTPHLCHCVAGCALAFLHNWRLSRVFWGMLAGRSKSVGAHHWPKLITPGITFEITQPIRPRCINVTDRQTSRHTDRRMTDLQ